MYFLQRTAISGIWSRDDCNVSLKSFPYSAHAIRTCSINFSCLALICSSKLFSVSISSVVVDIEHMSVVCFFEKFVRKFRKGNPAEFSTSTL